jgi:hypothetical protein
MAGTAREEAERLVVAVLAIAGQKDETLSGTAHRVTEGLGSLGETLAGVAGRVVAGLRDPNAHTAERLASGAGDLATSVAGVMRAVSVLTSNPRPKPARPARPAPPTPDEAWSTATRVTEPVGGQVAPPADDAPASDVWSAASRADAVVAAAEQAEQRAAAAHRAAAAQAARRAAEAARRVEAARKSAEAQAGLPPASQRDIWAAATAERSVAPEHNVDHDVAGPGDDARAGDGV